MTLTNSVVIKVMGGSDFDHSSTKVHIHIAIRNNRDAALAKRKLHGFANQVAVGLTDSPPDSRPQDGLAQRVARYEAELIREALTRHQGDIRQVTADLKIPRKTLYDKMTRHGLVPARHRLRDPEQKPVR